MKYLQNLHTHSTYCDGKDTLEEMILSAIEQGFQSVGFSGHSYMHYSPGHSMSIAGTEEYKKEIAALKEKYKGQLDIFCGLEVDMYSEVDLSGYDYLFGTAHYLKKDGILVVNDCRIDPMTVVIGAKEYPENILETLQKTHSVYSIDGQKIAKELDNSKVLNSVVLGYSARFIGFDETSWLETVESTVPSKTIELNKQAFTKGYNAHS